PARPAARARALPDAVPISGAAGPGHRRGGSGRLVLGGELGVLEHRGAAGAGARLRGDLVRPPREYPPAGTGCLSSRRVHAMSTADRKSTRLNSSHDAISYA